MTQSELLVTQIKEMEDEINSLPSPSLEVYESFYELLQQWKLSIQEKSNY